MQQRPNHPPTGPLDARRRKSLKARAHRLQPTLHVGKAGPSHACVEQLNRMFQTTDLIKIRIQAQNTADADAIGRRLAQAASCHLVARIGKTILLYKPPPATDATPEANEQHTA